MLTGAGWGGTGSRPGRLGRLIAGCFRFGLAGGFDLGCVGCGAWRACVCVGLLVLVWELVGRR